jgi:DNA-binding transcriptional LysR family regulator
MDKLFAMRVFKEVIERGAFARAAHHLGIAPASVTRHVAELERQLGTPLLVRTTRSLTLTQRGEIYLERVRSILADIQEADATVGTAATTFSGVLKISVPVIFGLYFLPPLLLKFQKQYPSVQFDLMLTDDPVDFIVSGREICLTYAENVSQPDTVTRLFVSSQTVLCATRPYLSRSAKLNEIPDLLNHQCLSARSPSGDRWRLRSIDGTLISFDVLPTIVCDTSAMVYECVRNGLGVGRIPKLLADDAIGKGQMVRVLETYECLGAELILAYPGRSYLTSKARAFIEFILSNVPDDS